VQHDIFVEPRSGIKRSWRRRAYIRAKGTVQEGGCIPVPGGPCSSASSRVRAALTAEAWEASNVVPAISSGRGNSSGRPTSTSASTLRTLHGMCSKQLIAHMPTVNVALSASR
jgi:hypothetical protein